MSHEEFYKRAVNADTLNDRFIDALDAIDKQDMKEQVGGDHYLRMKFQPLEITLGNLGYEAFRGACVTKILKYIMRDKEGDDYKGQLEKAAHVLSVLISETKEEDGNPNSST